MTIHTSLRGGNSLVGERSVLSRNERIQKLAKDGKLDVERGSAWGLPKVRTKFKVGIKKAKAAPAEAAAIPATAPAEAEKKAPDKKAPDKKAPEKADGKKAEAKSRGDKKK